METDADALARAAFRKQTLWDKIKYPVQTLWHWTYSNLHLAKETYYVLDFIYVHKIGPRLLASDHPWLTGLIPGTRETVWEKNIVFASPRAAKWQVEPEQDQIIVSRIGTFLAAMVARSNAPDPAVPHGKRRRMSHAVNYLHGAIHCNGGFLIFNNFQDAMFYFSDTHFVQEFKRFARVEKRELTIVLRERGYDPEEYAWFVGFVRAHQPWYANGNGPTKRRVLYGTPSPYPAVNPINGAWVDDMQHLYRQRMAQLVRYPVECSRYFQSEYRGNQSDFTFMERFHVWTQHLVITAKGFQGGLVFTSRKKIEPENWINYQVTNGQWRASHRISHPFMRIAQARAKRRKEGTDGSVPNVEIRHSRLAKKLMRPRKTYV